MERKKDQIYGQLKRAIMDETLPPGSRLPTEKQLAKSLSVGQVTLRSALARLEAEGLVERIRNRGTFVTEHCKRRTFLLIQPDGTENLETPSRYIAAGLEESAEKFSVTLEICPESLFVSFSSEERAAIVRSHSISGIFLETGHRMVSEKVLTAVKELELPVVIPHGSDGDASNGVLLLKTDEKQAFKEAYLFLKKHGHKRIASLFLVLPEEHGDVRGFSQGELNTFLRENGLSSESSLTAYLPNVTEEIRKQVNFWMDLPDRPTAILCHSDRVAMRVCAFLRESGVRIPEDVSVMGYSNYPGSQFLLPPLTTIDTKLKECAHIAMEKLLNSADWYKKDVIPATVFTPFVLIERASVSSLEKGKKKK
ncbi:MAG: substrate-binding domain-containing protein [Lentisphaeria bacterium]|nr:substrate-binding domain-containing protein [Lentisphaeria bacterium]